MEFLFIDGRFELLVMFTFVEFVIVFLAEILFRTILPFDDYLFIILIFITIIPGLGFTRNRVLVLVLFIIFNQL